MERQEPTFGDGARPAPPRETRSPPPLAAVVVVIVALIAAAAIAAYFFWPRGAPPPPPGPERAAVPAAPALPAAKGPQHPLEAEATDQPLPTLKESDGPVAAALSALIGSDAFGRVFLTENLVRNIVATVDNLPRDSVARRVNPLQPVPGLPATTGKGSSLALAPSNSARYAAYMRLVDGVGADKLVSFYRRHYPLFQEAYVELGYPNGYFNDRLVEVVDHLLETPEPAGPIRLTQPKVLYEFADPQLEELSAGQKMMLRIGKDNRERVKAKLREIRAALH
jgi:DUF3014 family protein